MAKMPQKETIRNLFDVDGNMKTVLERYKETLALSGGPKRQKDDCCCVGGRMSIFPRKAPPAGGPGALLMTASNYGSALIRASIPNPRVTATRGLTNWGAREARGTRETSAHHAWRHLARAVHISRPASVALLDPLALQLWNPLSSSDGRSQQNQFWLVEQQEQKRQNQTFKSLFLFLQDFFAKICHQYWPKAGLLNDHFVVRLSPCQNGLVNDQALIYKTLFPYLTRPD